MPKLNEAQKKISGKLRYGDHTRIAKHLGLSPNYVSMVIRGLYMNEKIWEVAALLAEEHDQTERRLQITLEQTASKLL